MNEMGLKLVKEVSRREVGGGGRRWGGGGGGGRRGDGVK